ncbi:MAG: histidine kinase N-terminal 7TM domain-containing protein, partial [Candidatus Margulisiibacteriota bacterium]
MRRAPIIYGKTSLNKPMNTHANKDRDISNLHYTVFAGALLLFGAAGIIFFFIKKDLSSFLLFITTLAAAFMAYSVFWKNPGSEINRSFSLFVLSIAIWAFCIMMTFLGGSKSSILFWIRFVYVGGILIPSSFLNFSCVFPQKDKNFGIGKLAAIYFPAVLFFLILPTDLIISSRTVEPWNFKPVYGAAYPLFTFFVLSFMIFGFLNMLRKYSEARGIERMQMRYVFWGISLSVPFGVVTNLILPLAGISSFNRIGPVVSLIFLSFVSYSIVKYRSLNVEIMVRRGLVFTATTAFVFAVYIVAVVLSEQVLRELVGYKSLLITVFAAFILALSYRPFYGAIQKFIDRNIFKKRAIFLEKIRLAQERIVSTNNFNDLAAVLVETILDTMGIEKVSFLLFDDERRKFRTYLSAELTERFKDRYGSAEIDKNSEAVKRLSESREVLIRGDIKRIKGLNSNEES